ncbi:hypothetical protein HYV70_02110 [Candidatus Uhrbacteria bacterium]|nr:hypothetical protein [Candidatus Uhrbacteria bacterium]
MASEPVLCYVDGDTAYFTTLSLDLQQGDEWGKCNSPSCHEWDDPYTPIRPEHFNQDGSPKWRIIIVKWICWGEDLKAPNEEYGLHVNVYEINSKAVPWLTNGDLWHDEEGNMLDRWLDDGPIEVLPWSPSQKIVNIFAGTTLEEFKRIIESLGGSIKILEE